MSDGIAPMRIALVTYALHVGGMENFLLMLAAALRKRGHQITFFVTEEIGAWQQRAIDSGFEVRFIGPQMLQSRRHQAQRMLPLLARFDAIILNHSALGQAIVGQTLGDSLRIAILHNDHPSIYDVGLANLEWLDCVVCVGTKILSETRRRGCPQERAVHIPYGVVVPPRWPKEQSAPRNGEPLRVIFVGRINHPQKGVFDLPPILAKARQLGANFTFEMVGDGGSDFDKLRQRFTNECPDLPVVYHGRKSGEDTLALLAQADVLLMPSRFEGFPVTLLEALSLGVVPIASRLPGIIDDAVTDDVNGILPEVGGIDAFAAAIVRLENDDLRRKMSQAAWTTAREKFQDSTMVDRYVELLQRPPRPQPANSPTLDSIGRELFGLAWTLPVGLAKLIAVIREGRVLKSLRRRLSS
jgi:glycosyltransferase involved in cell wall biosynthesis